MSVPLAAVLLCVAATGDPAAEAERRLRAALERDVNDSNALMRFAAVRLAAQMEPAFARPLIEPAVADRSYLVALEAVRLVGRLRLVESLPAVTRALRAEAATTRPTRPGSDYTRQEFLLAYSVTLERMSDPGGRATLDQLARHPRAVVRQRVAEELKGVSSQTARSILRRLATDGAANVREAAAYAWRTDGDDSAGLALLIALADDRDRYVRAAALQPLSEVSPGDARPRLKAALEDSFRGLRKEAVDVLAEMGQWTTLWDAEPHQPLYIQAHIAAAAARRGRPAGRRRLLALLRAALEHPRGSLTAQYIVAELGEIGLREAAPDLARIARGEVKAHAANWGLRLKALTAMTRLDDPRAAPELEALYWMKGVPFLWRPSIRQLLASRGAPPSAAFISRLIEGTNPADRHFALGQLKRAEPAAAHRRARAMLRDGPDEDRVVAALVLLALDDPTGAAELQDRLAAGSTATRQALARQIGATARPAALPLLLPLLDDPKTTVRLAAERGILRVLQMQAKARASTTQPSH